MASIVASGLGSGLDIGNLVTQLVAAERQSADLRLTRRETGIQAEISAVGALKGALSDFQTALQGLTSLSSFQQRSVSSSDSDILTGSADSSAASGNFDVVVKQLATSQKLLSQGFTDGDTEVGTGTLTLAVGSDAFTVSIDDSNKSLSGIAEAINDASDNTGVSASILNVDKVGGGTESKLVLTANDTGQANKITVTVNDDDGNHQDTNGISQLVYDPDGSGTINMSELQGAKNAEITVDQQLITRSSNTIDDAINGVTLNLVSEDPASTVSLTVSQNKGNVTRMAQSFVDSFNELHEILNHLGRFDAETGARGLLNGDAALRAISTQLRRTSGDAVEGASGAFNTLAAIGITTEKDGGLSLDSGKLNEALDGNFDAVGELFASEDGIAVQLDSLVDSFIGFNTILDSRTEGLNGRLEDIGEQRETLDRRMAKIEQRLQKQFGALDALVAQMRSTGDFLTQQLANLPGAVTSKN